MHADAGFIRLGVMKRPTSLNPARAGTACDTVLGDGTPDLDATSALKRSGAMPGPAWSAGLLRRSAAVRPLPAQRPVRPKPGPLTCDTKPRQDMRGTMVGADGITVWMVAVDAIPKALLPRLAGLLNAAERKRADCFLFDRHMRQYQAAHAMKRLMLTAAVRGAVAPEAWRFEMGAHGKPRVARGAGPQFNLSHTDGLVACAVSQRVELGIDVEDLDQHAPLELAGTYFARAEEGWLRGLPEAARQTGFFRLWTLKEAYVKATGLGLAQPLDALAFGFDPLHVTFTDPALGDPAAWRFVQRQVGARHILALAWQAVATEVPVEVAAVRLEALLARICNERFLIGEF